MMSTRSYLALVSGLAFVVGAGCVTDELDEPELGVATAHSEVVTSPPRMRVQCYGCSLPGHIVGEPVRIATSFHGECKTPPWHTDYWCNSQPYALTIECAGGPCAQVVAGGDAWQRYTDVTPLAAGPLTIRVRMNDTWFSVAPFESSVPEEIRVTCRTGAGYDQPCVTGANEQRARLRFEVFRGEQRLSPNSLFEITSDQPGVIGGDAHDTWYLSAPGVHRVRATYGAVSRDVEVTIATPPPPPPPPAPPAPRDAGRQSSPAMTSLAPR
jgi:hypothetical protein